MTSVRLKSDSILSYHAIVSAITIRVHSHFGIHSLELVSCVVDEELKDCTVPIAYSYKFRNTGNLDADQLLARSDLGGSGDVRSLLRNRRLRSGESITETESTVIDGCVDGDYMATVTVMGASENNKPCVVQDEYVYEFDNQVPCRMDLDIGCENCEVLDDGGDCSPVVSFPLDVINIGSNESHLLHCGGSYKRQNVFAIFSQLRR